MDERAELRNRYQLAKRLAKKAYDFLDFYSKTHDIDGMIYWSDQAIELQKKADKCLSSLLEKGKKK